MTSQLEELADWLVSEKVTLAGMESTGVYWKPVYYVLEERLPTIPGVGRRLAEVIIAEVGLDMSVFPTAGHLASWAWICPGNNSSGGKRRAGPNRHGSVWLEIASTEAARAAARTKAPT